MQPKSYRILHWLYYTLATIFLFTAQDLLCRFLSVAGIYPFLYPSFAAIVSCYEGIVKGSLFGLLLGLFCDLLLPGPFEGFYCIVFTLCAIVAAQIVKRALHNRFFGCVFTSTLALLLTAVSRCLLLLGHAPATLLFSTAAVETLLTLPLLPLPISLYAFVQKFCPDRY